MRLFATCLMLILGICAESYAAEIRNGQLYDSNLRSPVPLSTIEKTEFHYDRIDESLATNAQELEYIRLRNDEELWVKSKRYAVIDSQRIPITIDQEYQILTAKIRGAQETPRSSGAETLETIGAVNSLQLESLERANAEMKSIATERLARFEAKTFRLEPKVKEFNRNDVPKSLSLWRAIIDNQNVFIEHTGDTPAILPTERTVRVTLRDPLLCNLPTVKPASNPNFLFFELRNGASTYWVHVYQFRYDALLKTFVTATAGGQTLCFNDRILKSGFEDGELGPR